MNATNEALEARIKAERERRLADQPWHYWIRSGRSEPPESDNWCSYCAGFFGVTHTYTHDHAGYCRQMYRPHQCACIVCWVFQGRSDQRYGERTSLDLALEATEKLLALSPAGLGLLEDETGNHE